MKEHEITDYNYIGSAIGNAYFSGISFQELWLSISISETREELDTAIATSIKMKEIINNGR